MRSVNMRRIASLFSFLALVWTISAYAQAVSGNIDGTVSDSSGAAVPNAAISITDVDRGTVFRTSSNAEGNYSQIHLLAGHYQVKVESAGFAEFAASVIVQVD